MPDTVPDVPDTVTRVLGGLLLLLGLTLLIWGLNADYTVRVPALGARAYYDTSPIQYSRVANISLVFTALRNLIAGGFLTIAGLLALLIGWPSSRLGQIIDR